MSLKPPKRSDLDKSWMKPRRDKPKKIQPEYHLIVTEGTDTEPSASTPGTKVYELVEKLKPYLTENM